MIISPYETKVRGNTRLVNALCDDFKVIQADWEGKKGKEREERKMEIARGGGGERRR